MSIAVVTGAGSGVGGAVAIRLAESGHSVALVSRREQTLKQTIELADPAAGPRMLVSPCDISDERAVAAMAQQVRQRLGEVDLLVNAAGTNSPERSLETLAIDKYHEVMGANINGAYYCVQAFLPGMRQRGRGLIVLINSLAGLRASELSGVAYSMSKFALAGLGQSINAEENKHGVRCCSIFPGDIHTPLLDKRPNPPAPEARQRMLAPEDVADCVMLAATLPEHAVLEQVVIRPRK
jgi:NADP-dependent 3-hydroxy acid dehydrogenase YdfG